MQSNEAATVEKPEIKKEPVAKEAVHGMPEAKITYQALGEGELKCEAIKGQVKGKVIGEEYFGRRIVVVESLHGVFGEGVIKRKADKRYTIHNGHINQCDIREGVPTPYWVVMDMMSDQERFSKDSIIDASVERLKAIGSKEPRVSLRTSCKNAYNVLTTHNKHPSKIRSGMSHMCDIDPSTESGVRHMIMRGRRKDETVEYFEGIKRALKESRKDKPIISRAVSNKEAESI
jgi:hypothetical protein